LSSLEQRGARFSLFAFRFSLFAFRFSLSVACLDETSRTKTKI
jgi:hypothetical protein